MAITSGLYELRSMLLTTMCVDVAYGSAVRGSNVQLYSANDSNAQKFYLVEEAANSWSIQNANSKLYMDVAKNVAANGANVQQWTDNDSRAQRWRVIETGETAIVNGVECPVVALGSYVTTDGATYVADVSKAMTTNSTNIQLWRYNGSPAQRYALLPTTLLDTQMATPTGRGWAASIGAANAQDVQPAAEKLYPCWYFTDAWFGLQEHGFEISYRSRTIANGTANTGTWTDWTPWESPEVTIYGQTAWLTDGLPAALDTSAHKRLEYALRVRATATEDGETYHSRAITMSLAAVFAPTVKCTAATRVHDAVRLTFSTDYEGGTTAVRVLSATGSGTVLRKPIIGYGLAPTFTLDVPASSFSAAPEGSSLTVRYEVGTDQYPATGITHTDTVTLSDGAAKTITPKVTCTQNADDCSVTVDVTGGAAYRAYLFDGYEQIPVTQVSAGRFRAYPPFGGESRLLVYATNMAGSAWGYAIINLQPDYKPCHMWNWDGGYFKLAVSDGYMQTERTLKADYTEYQLSGREWHALSFANTMGGDFSAEGTLLEGFTDATKAQLLALMKAHTVTYRAPSGEVADVGITEVQYQTVRRRTSVSVNMVQVTK